MGALGKSRAHARPGRADALRYDSTFPRRESALIHVTEALQFVVNNWMLVAVAVVSGAMLAWPLIQRRLSPVREIGVQGATQLINRSDAIVLDVRETQEYEGGRLPHAVHIPLSQLKSRGQELAKFVGRPLIAYCERGSRARTAASALVKLGFSEIFVLHGGLRAWTEAGMPLDKG